MKEQASTLGVRRMGQERWKYLDMANMSFIAGDYLATNGYIKAFLETIPEETDEAREITKEFNRIEADRKRLHVELEEQAKNLGYLEKGDILTKGREQIEIDAIMNRKTVCWTVAMKYGLFSA